MVTSLNQLSKTLTAIADDCTDGVVSATPEEKQEEAAPKETKAKEPEEPAVTIEDVRAVLAEKSQAGLTGKVKELLESFGANKLSAVSKADYSKLLDAAKKL